MNRPLVIPAVCLLVFMIFLGFLTWMPLQHPTSTTVSVEEGTVSVYSKTDSNQEEKLTAGESVVASQGLFDRVESASSEPDLTLASTQGTAGQVSEATEASLPSPVEIIAATKTEYWVAGYSYAEDGKPIQNTDVTAFFPRPDPRIGGNAKTNAEGFYRIRLPELSQYTLSASPPDGYLFSQAEIVLSASESSIQQNFTHGIAGLSVRGKVLSKVTNEPIADANVTINPWYQEVKEGQRSVSGKTNAQGLFTLKGLTEGYYHFEAEAEGYITFSPTSIDKDTQDPLGRVHVSEKDQGLEYVIKMVPGYAATIRVLDPQKKPVPEADVTVYSSGNLNRIDDPKKTDNKGEYTVKTLPQALAVAYVKKYPWGEAVSDGFQPEPQEKPVSVEVQLTESARLSGRVTDKEGNAIKNRSVGIAYEEINKSLGDMNNKIFSIEYSHKDMSVGNRLTSAADYFPTDLFISFLFVIQNKIKSGSILTRLKRYLYGSDLHKIFTKVFGWKDLN